MMNSLLSINHARRARFLLRWMVLLATTSAPLSAFAQVTATWNSTTGNWSDPTKWSTNPEFPNNGNGGFDYNAVINLGSVTLDTNILIQSLTLGGTISGSSNLTLNAASTWYRGAMSGAGTTTIAPSGSLSLTNGGSQLSLSRMLINNGTASWNNINWSFSGGTLENNGTFTALNNMSASGDSGTNVFNNHGTFIKQGTSTTTSFLGTGTGITFNNSGLVDIQSGNLNLLGGGTHTGDFTIASGSTLQLSGTHSFSATSDFTGPGTIYVSSGTATFDGQQDSNTRFSTFSGTVNFNETTTAGGLDMNTGTLAGTGNVTFNGASTWYRGTMSGPGTTTIGATGTLAIVNSGGSGLPVLSRTLVNDGNTTWNSSDWTFSGGSVENNGTFTALASNSASSSGGVNVFNNNGTFIKQGAGTIQFLGTGTGITFNNSGLVDIQSGNLNLLGGGTHTGDFTIASGSTLQLSGTHSFSATSDFTGPGTIYVSSGTATFDGQQDSNTRFSTFSGTVNFNETTTAGGLDMNTGTLAGTGNVTFNGASTWYRGTMSGPGTTTIGATGTLAIVNSGGSGLPVLSRTLVNEGNTTWNSIDWSFSGGTVENNGTFTALGGRSASSSGGVNVFNNHGTFINQGSTTQFLATGTGIAFNNSGLVDIQSGNLNLLGGGTHTGDFTIAAASTLTLNGTHNFATTSEVTGAGRITFNSGTTTFNGQQATSGTFGISGGGTVNFNETTNAGGLEFYGGTLAGTGDLTFSGVSTWANGTMSGIGTTTIAASASLAMINAGGGAGPILSRTLINHGTASWSGITWNFSGATVENNGTFTAISNMSASSIGGSNVFNNSGTFIKQGASTTTQFLATGTGIAFNNSGLVDIQSGNLNLLGGGTHTGDFAIAASTTLTLNGTHNFATTSEVTGAGRITVNSGTTTFNGQQATSGIFGISNGTILFNETTAAGGLELSGTLGGAGAVTFNDISSWTSGTMSGSGSTDFVSATITGNSTKFLNNRTLRSAGSINWSQGEITTSGTRGTIHIPNGSTFTISSNASRTLNANLLIDLGGTLLHTSTGTNTHTAGTFINNGLVQVDAGILQFNSGGSGSGEFIVSPGASLRFNGLGHNYNGGVTLSGGTLQLTTFSLTNGTVQGTGTIAATTFTNSSEVAPGISNGDEVGAIDVNGNYIQTSDGNLSIDLEGLNLGEFDTLDITGDALLGGTLTITVPDDGSIQAGDTFEIITAGDTMGTQFEEILTLGNDDLFFATVYTPDSVAALAAEPGDMNPFVPGIGEEDVAAFALAFTNPRGPGGYSETYGASAKEAGDVDGDGDLDVDDIDDFADTLGMTLAALHERIRLYSVNVPEPGSVVLATIVMLIGTLQRNTRGEL